MEDDPVERYTRLLRTLPKPREPPMVGATLFELAAQEYRLSRPGASLVEFDQAGATYLFDLASEEDQEERTVAAWAVSPAGARARDTAYQRMYPMPPTPDEAPVDRGHLVPHRSGGLFGPNIFRQDRALNRGWSPEGRAYRTLERLAAVPGAFFFGRLLYDDETSYPTHIELVVLRGDDLRAARFRNR
ncbi:hypothetical protein FHX82_007146 [Amycolatopsis bartoniae]|uniref:Uncharacterized protein n=1 Tax=Amycolatopsis bartoniae TaxID=941986 RepID=A0A8H9M551_9PSEU|nr:hypothetical protein [Amycolatopsis bartoniae]MBB2940060.1 hypothetical protein [Amycolatopsis bartoniae]TVT09459.1 hypothetical protein FNH07_08625 [Amycolatopsis bartoniae]GHF53666.1 hypothetical protein GCM10017566_28850 [Amycolatopsis bartoniae]